MSGQNVECGITFVINLPDIVNVTLEVTVDAIAEQCGTFPNTATASGSVGVGVEPPELFPFTVADTEEITVEGCEVPPAPEPGQQQGAPPAPITQDFEQESESGEIDQSFDIS